MRIYNVVYERDKVLPWWRVASGRGKELTGQRTIIPLTNGIHRIGHKAGLPVIPIVEAVEKVLKA